MQITKETITVKKAMEYIKRNINNRPLSRPWVEELSEIITAGEFKMNGDAIRFNSNGDLIDGQHRLHACILSGIPIETYVVRGLEHAAFDTIDQGKRRKSSDILARQGEKQYTALAAAVKAVHEIQNNYAITHKKAFRPSILQKTLAECDGIREVVDECLQMMRTNKARSLINPGVACAMMYLTRKSNRQLADLFWSRVYGGESLTKSMPEYLLRQRLTENATSVARLPRDAMVALVIKAWNAVKTGQSVKCLKWNSNEEFPMVQ